MNISVAIICHNYGRYLAEAIASVLTQTHRPAEVLIIDDASTDDTSAIAQAYAAQGVKYLRVETGNVWINRQLAAKLLSCKWMLCLDADNTIPPTYLERAVAIGESDPRCGVVYPSLNRFGDDARFVDFSAPRLPLSAANYIDASSVFRRESILQADLTDCCPSSNETAEDWILARRVLSAGWTARHNPQPVNYRVHGGNKHAGQDKARTYYADAGLEFEPVSIVVPLSGRSELWPMLTQWLDNQTWPRNQCRLLLIDNSHNDAFGQLVRQWVSACDYPDVRYSRVTAGRPGLANEQRTQRPDTDRLVHQTVASLYNRAFRETSTDYVLTLEDDIEAPINVIARLLRAMHPQVAAVTAAYRHRNGKHWLAWRGTAKRHEYAAPVAGVDQIDGCGFGCLLMRRLVTDSIQFATDGLTVFYDANAFTEIRKLGWRVLIDWSAECDHHAGVL
jgi:GT2 family glycosyltransferase